MRCAAGCLCDCGNDRAGAFGEKIRSSLREAGPGRPGGSAGETMISIHPPREGRDRCRASCLKRFRYFNPPAPCGAGPPGAAGLSRSTPSSIHPPRAGRDRQGTMCLSQEHDFNPPAPCGTGRPGLRGPAGKHDISIHPPRAGRDLRRGDLDPLIAISIHPPRAGRDKRLL